jgi:hypothetical protein
MRRVQIIGALCLSLVACLVGAASAGAAPTDPFQYKYSFAATEVENPRSLAVNGQTGNVIAFSEGVIKQFAPNGDPVDFSGTGSPTISVGGGDFLLVDNSGGPTQGNIYVFTYIDLGCFCVGGDAWWAFAPDGTPIGANPHSAYSVSEGGIIGGAVGPNGTVWLTTYNNNAAANPTTTLPVNPDGSAAGPKNLFVPERVALPGGAMDGLGNYYLPDSGGTFVKYDSNNNFAYLGDTGLPYAGEGSDEPVVIDPSTNDAYVRQRTRILGIHAADPSPATPFEALTGTAWGRGGFAFDSTGQTLYVAEGSRISVFHREPDSAPSGLVAPGVKEVRSDRAVLSGRFSAGGSPTSYRFEYGTSTAYGLTTPIVPAPLSLFPVKAVAAIEGLQPDTTYHVRMVATNAAGTTYGPDKVFKTYPLPSGAVDPCPNALARKQTLAGRLPDCRAYELASSSDTSGYDVESYLAPGQHPFPGFPFANDRLLYATHAGAVPGPWNATNKGPDPYVAVRTANGWVTQYEGLPSNLNLAAGSFSSVLGEADSSLGTLAFAGPNLCSPCFSSGLETGIPVRMPNGQLIQGMSGSLAGSVPATAKPEGRLAKYFSGDGKKLLFASEYAFEPGANDENGSLNVYARDLNAGTTEIVSTDPSGNTLTGEGISELDVSADGSRVVIGRKVSADAQGNEYVHPYLHIAGRPGSIDLAPLASNGVLYAGMTSDGSKAFFTSPDKLTGSDTDTSADLYEADVDGSGGLDLKAITTSSSNACNPVANSNGAHWNTTGANVDCSAVAISGGGGVASSTGAIYFLSPESFAGQGALNQPNLYLASPSGSTSFVATLEPNNPLVLDSVKANATRRTGDFQTTPSGNYGAFASNLQLTGVAYFGLRNVFEFNASSGQLLCPSCDTSGSTDDRLATNVELAPNGLSLLEDGRIFFSTSFPLLLNDANGRKDVYEWSEGKQQLISAGTGPFDSALLSVSADGTDVFFFTHDQLAPEEDHNGSLMRIYDAREGGGAFRLPASVPCQASDECHGPGTPAPGVADIKSSGKTTQGNVVVCPKNRVKKRGQCVKKTHSKKKHQRKHPKKRKGAAKKRAAGTNGKRGGRNA